MSWSTPASFNEVCRRAGGRRAYNSWRTFTKILRRHDVARLLLEYGHKRGVQARIAAVLGVSEATVSRDLQAVLYAPHVCQHCGSYKPREIKFMNGENVSVVLGRDERRLS